MEKINIFEYLDYRAFLKAFYSSKKCQNTQFSYTLWGKEAGINNRSYLRLVISGHRNLTDDGIKKVLPTLGLRKIEQNYFIGLVKFNQASTIDEKEREFIACKQLSLKITRVVFDTYAFLSSHWYPKIQVILGLGDIDRCANSIAKMIGLPISEVNNYLRALEEQGIAECIEGQWITKNKNFYVNDDQCGNFAIQSFHRKSLEIATNAIDKDPNERYFNSVLFALSQEEYESLNFELSSFTDQLLAKYANASNGKEKKIYQINVNNIPVSNSLIHLNESETNKSFTGSKPNMVCKELCND